MGDKGSWPTIEWLATRTEAADAAVPREEAVAILERINYLESQLQSVSDALDASERAGGDAPHRCCTPAYRIKVLSDFLSTSLDAQKRLREATTKALEQIEVFRDRLLCWGIPFGEGTQAIVNARAMAATAAVEAREILTVALSKEEE